jgi:hypothetical protein
MVHDTWHSLAAELHTHAAYEHWVADYRQKRGEDHIAQDFARRAYEHSDEAAELSKEAFRQGPIAVGEHLSAQQAVRGQRTRSAEPARRARDGVKVQGVFQK